MKMNHGWKKGLLCLGIAGVLAGTSMPVSAYNTEEHIEESVGLQYVGMQNMNCFLNILDGNAKCSGSVSLKSGYTASLVLTLQRSPKSITSWSTIKTWTGTRSSLSKNYAISSGYKYRVILNAKVYNSKNVLVDNSTVYSNVSVY